MIRRCKNCGALVEWVPTTAGADKRVPLDVKPVNVGVVVDVDIVRVISARTLHPRECSAKKPKAREARV